MTTNNIRPPGARFVFRVLIGLACSGWLIVAGCSPGEPEDAQSTPLVKVNDDVLTVDDFRQALTDVPQEQRLAYTNPAGRQHLLQTLISMELLHQEGLRQGLDKDKTIQEQLNRERRKLIINHMLHGNIGMAEILRYFQENFVRVRHIVLTFKPDMTDIEKEKQRQVLERIRQRLLDGEDYLALSRRYSQDTNAATGGEVGYVSRYDHRLSGFTEAAFALKEPMDISAVVITEVGQHIIQLLEAPGHLDPRGLTPELQDGIIQAIGQDRFRTYLAELYPQADIQINHDALSQIGIGTQAPGAPPPADANAVVTPGTTPSPVTSPGTPQGASNIPATAVTPPSAPPAQPPTP